MRFLPVALLVACGTPDFTGRFRGSFDRASGCFDGSGGSAIAISTWVVQDTGTEMNIFTGGIPTCPKLRARPSAGYAEIEAITCQPYPCNATACWETIRAGGKLTMVQDKLLVHYSAFVAIRDASGKQTGCDDVVDATLLRQF